MTKSLYALLGPGILAVAALIGPTPGLARADFLTKDDLRTSSWDTHYTVNGQRVHAIVTFNGDSGSYAVLDSDGNTLATGDLSPVFYTVNQFNGAFAISGNWSLNGESGQFTFRSVTNNPFQFRGTWTGGLKRGRWDGAYSP